MAASGGSWKGSAFKAKGGGNGSTRSYEDIAARQWSQLEPREMIAYTARYGVEGGRQRYIDTRAAQMRQLERFSQR